MFNNRIEMIFDVKDFEYSVFLDKFRGFDLDLLNSYSMSVFVVPIDEDISKLSLQKVEIINIHFGETRAKSENLLKYLFCILKDGVEYSVDKNMSLVKKDGLVCHNFLYVFIDEVVGTWS
jgi:hypothetical protein